MILPLLLAALSPQSTIPIDFANGVEAAVEIRPDDVDFRRYSSATAFLRVPSRNLEKAVVQCEVSSRAEWFHRKDGSIVLLVQCSRFIEAFTITATGKVYPHDEPWFADAILSRHSPNGARIIFSIHTESQEAKALGADAPQGKDLAIIAYDWSRKQQRWVPGILSYE